MILFRFEIWTLRERIISMILNNSELWNFKSIYYEYSAYNTCVKYN